MIGRLVRSAQRVDFTCSVRTLPKMIAKLLQQRLHGGCSEQVMHVVQELTKCLIEQSLRLGRQKTISLWMRIRSGRIQGRTIYQWGEGRRGCICRCDVGGDRSMRTYSGAFGATDFSWQTHAVSVYTVLWPYSSINMMKM